MASKRKQPEKKSADQMADEALVRWQKKLEWVKSCENQSEMLPRRGDWLLFIYPHAASIERKIFVSMVAKEEGSDSKISWNLEAYRSSSGRSLPLCFSADSFEALYPGDKDSNLLDAAGVQYLIKFAPQCPHGHNITSLAQQLGSLCYDLDVPSHLPVVCTSDQYHKRARDDSLLNDAKKMPKRDAKKVLEAIERLRDQLDDLETFAESL